MALIEGYASRFSVAPGETLDFHVRCDPAHRDFTLEILRRGATDVSLKKVDAIGYAPGKEDDGALAVNGCDWPAAAAAQTVIPAGWKSGYYVARLTSKTGGSAGIPFIVRSAQPGKDTKILLKWSDTTVQAYSAWGGRDFYNGFSPQLSFDRPYDSTEHFEKYTRPLVAWAESNGFTLDHCSSVDLHTDPNLLTPYKLMISTGHDEYWSKEMYDHCEAFVGNGGNIAFLSANTCYWQVRFDFSNGKRIMTCYKETEDAPGHPRPKDPQRADPSRVTVRFYEPPVNRPENRLTGVSFRNGAGWFNGKAPNAARLRGYTVVDDSHWIYAGTNLKNGQSFGEGTSDVTTVLGYETDAAELEPNVNPAAVTGNDGTPSDFKVLAYADLRDWQQGGQGGHATLGLYQRNGTVFTGATINWAAGLTPNTSPVAIMTKNLFQKLGR
ncbi:MAG TPA: N,N-dimethylformamidase beta subunit family domain-containing protein [Candidatus Limnocylindrales bacterium]|nr:N,N-dimethylformamidase beta subunit family domain-containing protein [Candidatus Limnocylindrales bacterium]